LNDLLTEHTDGGSDFLGALDESVEDIALAPWRWPVVQGISPSTRRRLMNRYPYSVFYRVDDQGVLIISIAHQSREPIYWLGR